MSSSKSNRKDSQFAGAAKLFQEMDQKTPSQRSKPKVKMGGADASSEMHGSLNNIFSPMKKKASQNSSSLKPPSFVSPGGAAGRPSWKTDKPSPATAMSSSSPYTSSYLDKPSGSFASTPSQRGKPKTLMGFGGSLPLSPSPTNSKPKVDGGGKYWNLSFQASPSPGALKKQAVKPAFNQHYGGSYIEKSQGGGSSSGRFNDSISNFEETPDIRIQVTIPNIDKKMKARKAKTYSVPKPQEENVPEWMLKQRQREENVRRKQQEKEDKAASLITAIFWAHIARKNFPRLLLENRERLAALKAKERLRQLQIQAVVRLQKTWRMVLPRKRFLYLQDCRRRREKNKKEIKRIEKVISKMPKNTKAEIKDMKKAYAEKKKDLKKQMKKMLKEDDKKLESIQKSGQNMIDYMKQENEKLKEMQRTVKREHKLLEQQFEVLTQKSDEIAKHFVSLQSFVEKKKASNQKHEINSQKCRHRYLPKYRELIKERDLHCIVEHRIQNLYKKRLEAILELLHKNCKDASILLDAQEAMAQLEQDLDLLPIVPIPEGLEERL